MTSRERVLNALNGKQVDRTPVSLGFGVRPPVKKELMRLMGFDSVGQTDEYLQSFSDLRWVGPKYVGPPSRNFTDENGIYTDVWGVKRAEVNYRADDVYWEICEYPLAKIENARELHDYEFPSAGWFDYASLTEQIESHGNKYAIVMGNGNIFETAWYMRGLDTMLMDLISDQELAAAFLTKVTDFYIEYFSRALSVANRSGENPIDIVFTADDVGTQEGLMLSLDLWEKMIKPHHKRLNGVLHGYGAKVMYHSDGAVSEALEGLIDMGIDVLEALQFEAKGMSPEYMKNNFGDRLCFHGGVSVQSTFPFGSPDDVSNEVAERIRVLGKNGGYIIAPSHAVQAGTPAENLVAFLNSAAGL